MPGIANAKRAARRWLAVFALVAGCASSPPPAPPASFFAEEWNACGHVFTEADTQALHEAAKALAPVGSCTFDGVYVRGWQAVIAFAGPGGGKAEAMLQPSACESHPLRDSIVGSTYTLTQAEGAADLCPQAMSALAGAVRDGSLPPPTKVEPKPAEPAAAEAQAVEAPAAGPAPQPTPTPAAAPPEAPPP